MVHARDVAVLAVMMIRFPLRVMPIVRAQLRECEQAAAAIPHPRLRAHAVETLRSERFSALGAGLVALTARRHNPALVRMLVALAVAWDYIDTLSEQPSADAVANGRQLHRALLDAVSIGPPSGDYYRHSALRDDGGYLAALVGRCREAAAQLPRYGVVQDAVVEEVRRSEIQHQSHAPAPQRAKALRRWAARHGAEGPYGWIELAAAASSPLGVLALLALAADPGTSGALVERVRAAYVPWADALTSLLDSVVDREDDLLHGAMNWVSHFPSPSVATARLRTITTRAVAEARELPRGERHVAIIVGMVAMYLSSRSAWRPATERISRAVLRATGTAMMPLLLGLLRAWRRLPRSARGTQC